jgi:hypothetical protein
MRHAFIRGFPGYRTRHTLDEFLEMAISLNAIHPDEYLTDMLLKPHEVIGALADEGDQLNNATPVYFFPDTGVYAAAVSETRVLDAALLAMLPGELVTRPLELHRQDTNLTDPVAGRLSQLHVLILKPLLALTCCQASPDSRSAPVLQPITFCFLFIFSPFPQSSRAAWTGHHCRMWGLNKGRVVRFARCRGRPYPLWDEDMQVS